MDLLFRFNSGNLNPTGKETIKLLNEISDAVNRKMKKIETEQKIKFKLQPLPTNLSNSNGIPVPVRTNIVLDGNLRGEVPVDTFINVSPMLTMGPYIVDPSGPQIKQIVSNIKRYLEIIIVVNRQFEMLANNEITKEQLSSDYFTFV
jgi:hypothetical protein